ncbi:hypothetical protein [Mesorhizobium sp. M8A.F.Ca.ET.021.01.1.1]|uniref:hypothetical protein n=1 Tax=Mesorhizobium sp. M8A.F.Ca.ET.021.01.1.1 TaxID=2496757 RepID=UPI000FCB2D0D|nr:hypothetical protein [Mesorhizobium sp. M8A.F.Ca.ET.021.01.1.1]RUW56734.1 hypothetical protein EOA36_02805 [Mesorhizobium sp. M8A.F.Ca.ET.021.01.1.1]
MSIAVKGLNFVQYASDIDPEAEDQFCQNVNGLADTLKSLAERGISLPADRIEVATDLGALITKLQRVQTELTFESPMNGIVGSLAGGIPALA